MKRWAVGVATWRLALVLVALSQVAATDCGQVIDDSGFDLWCGDRLCDWTVEGGAVAPAPTWHDGDVGVALVGDGAVLAQTAPLTSLDGTCVEFDMVTNVAADAEVHLQMDVFADGLVDYDVRIPTASWAPVSYRVIFAAPFQGIRFRLIKTGAGAAVLAQIAAHVVEGCSGAPVALPPRALGAWCGAAADCASGACNGVVAMDQPPPICGACASDATCGAGQVCGTVEPGPTFLVPYRACIAAGARSLGQLCAEDAECATAACVGGTCSACAGDGDCQGAETCQQVGSQLTSPGGDPAGWPWPPFECDPGAGQRRSGDACLVDADCASDDCRGKGALGICASGGPQGFAGDGRTCASDLECPANGKHVPGACVVVGILGGTCQ